MIIGFDFGESVFIHAILHSQDDLNTGVPRQDDFTNLINFFQNYEIYIGNNTDYSKNHKCAGGPFLNPNEPTTYVFDSNADDYAKDPYLVG